MKTFQKLICLSHFLLAFTPCYAEDSIKVGVMVPLTGGTVASHGEQVRDGILLAKKQSSLPGLELIFEDSQCQGRIAFGVAKNLIDVNHVKLIIGDVCWTDLIAPVTEAKQVVVISPGSAQSSVRDAGDFIFRLKLDVSVDSRALARPLISQANVKKAAVLFVQDNWGEGIAKNFEEEFVEEGGKILTLESFQQGDTDFKVSLLKIRSHKPEVLVIAAYPPQIGLIGKQARELGLSMQIATYGAAIGEETITLGGANVEGLMFMEEFDLDSDRPTTIKFVENFKKHYGHDPTLMGALGFDSYNLFAITVQKCQSDTKCIRDSLYAIKGYDGVSGLISFDDHGDVIKPLKFKRIQHGRRVSYDAEKLQYQSMNP